LGAVDFTNPAARDWFAGYLLKLLNGGADCFKTDFDELISTDVEYYDGSDPVAMEQGYFYLYHKNVYELLEKELGQNRALVFSRTARVGSQRFPVQWGGDCWANYESMAENLRGGLSLGLSGFGFWSHDIGGFENTAPADLYKRWIAFGLLSSHSRLHAGPSYRAPWLMDEEIMDVLRFFTKLKCSLMPYLFMVAGKAVRQGIPMMRAMILEYPQDPACEYLDRQYMLGDSLLVAPVLSGDGTVSYYLPAGNWTRFLTGETVTGGGWRKERHSYMSIPFMVRPNTIIAIGSNQNRPDYDYASQVCLHLFELEEGRAATTKVYNPDGKAELEVTATRNHNIITVKTPGVGKPWSVLLRGRTKIKALEGGSSSLESRGILINPFQYTGTLWIELE
jgi:alpha-D-xyloside xylohydrolase